jgi:hypothetical protein
MLAGAELATMMLLLEFQQQRRFFRSEVVFL